MERGTAEQEIPFCYRKAKLERNRDTPAMFLSNSSYINSRHQPRKLEQNKSDIIYDDTDRVSALDRCHVVHDTSNLPMGNSFKMNYEEPDNSPIPSAALYDFGEDESTIFGSRRAPRPVEQSYIDGRRQWEKTDNFIQERNHLNMGDAYPVNWTAPRNRDMDCESASLGDSYICKRASYLSNRTTNNFEEKSLERDSLTSSKCSNILDLNLVQEISNNSTKYSEAKRETCGDQYVAMSGKSGNSYLSSRRKNKDYMTDESNSSFLESTKRQPESKYEGDSSGKYGEDIRIKPSNVSNNFMISANKGRIDNTSGNNIVKTGKDSGGSEDNDKENTMKKSDGSIAGGDDMVSETFEANKQKRTTIDRDGNDRRYRRKWDNRSTKNDNSDLANMALASYLEDLKTIASQFESFPEAPVEHPESFRCFEELYLDRDKTQWANFDFDGVDSDAKNGHLTSPICQHDRIGLHNDQRRMAVAKILQNGGLAAESNKPTADVSYVTERSKETQSANGKDALPSFTAENVRHASGGYDCGNERYIFNKINAWLKNDLTTNASYNKTPEFESEFNKTNHCSERSQDDKMNEENMSHCMDSEKRGLMILEDVDEMVKDGNEKKSSRLFADDWVKDDCKKTSTSDNSKNTDKVNNVERGFDTRTCIATFGTDGRKEKLPSEGGESLVSHQKIYGVTDEVEHSKDWRRLRKSNDENQRMIMKDKVREQSKHMTEEVNRLVKIREREMERKKEMKRISKKNNVCSPRIDAQRYMEPTTEVIRIPGYFNPCPKPLYGSKVPPDEGSHQYFTDEKGTLPAQDETRSASQDNWKVSYFHYKIGCEGSKQDSSEFTVNVEAKNKMDKKRRRHKWTSVDPNDVFEPSLKFLELDPSEYRDVIKTDVKTCNMTETNPISNTPSPNIEPKRHSIGKARKKKRKARKIVLIKGDAKPSSATSLHSQARSRNTQSKTREDCKRRVKDSRCDVAKRIRLPAMKSQVILLNSDEENVESEEDECLVENIDRSEKSPKPLQRSNTSDKKRTEYPVPHELKRHKADIDTRFDDLPEGNYPKKCPKPEQMSNVRYYMKKKKRVNSRQSVPKGAKRMIDPPVIPDININMKNLFQSIADLQQQVDEMREDKDGTLKSILEMSSPPRDKIKLENSSNICQHTGMRMECTDNAFPVSKSRQLILSILATRLGKIKSSPPTDCISEEKGGNHSALDSIHDYILTKRSTSRQSVRKGKNSKQKRSKVQEQQKREQKQYQHVIPKARTQSPYERYGPECHIPETNALSHYKSPVQRHSEQSTGQRAQSPHKSSKQRSMSPTTHLSKSPRRRSPTKASKSPESPKTNVDAGLALSKAPGGPRKTKTKNIKNIRPGDDGRTKRKRTRPVSDKMRPDKNFSSCGQMAFSPRVKTSDNSISDVKKDMLFDKFPHRRSISMSPRKSGNVGATKNQPSGLNSELESDISKLSNSHQSLVKKAPKSLNTLHERDGFSDVASHNSKVHRRQPESAITLPVQSDWSKYKEDSYPSPLLDEINIDRLTFKGNNLLPNDTRMCQEALARGVNGKRWKELGKTVGRTDVEAYPACESSSVRNRHPGLDSQTPNNSSQLVVTIHDDFDVPSNDNSHDLDNFELSQCLDEDEDYVDDGDAIRCSSTANRILNVVDNDDVDDDDDDDDCFYICEKDCLKQDNKFCGLHSDNGEVASRVHLVSFSKYSNHCSSSTVPNGDLELSSDGNTLDVDDSVDEYGGELGDLDDDDDDAIACMKDKDDNVNDDVCVDGGNIVEDCRRLIVDSHNGVVDYLSCTVENTGGAGMHQIVHDIGDCEPTKRVSWINDIDEDENDAFHHFDDNDVDVDDVRGKHFERTVECDDCCDDDDGRDDNGDVGGVGNDEEDDDFDDEDDDDDDDDDEDDDDEGDDGDAIGDDDENEDSCDTKDIDCDGCNHDNDDGDNDNDDDDEEDEEEDGDDETDLKY